MLSSFHCQHVPVDVPLEVFLANKPLLAYVAAKRALSSVSLLVPYRVRAPRTRTLRHVRADLAEEARLACGGVQAAPNALAHTHLHWTKAETKHVT